MAQINKPNTQFNTVLYTGNGGTQTITGVGFQPDFTWIKGRTGYGNSLYDVVRTYNYKILSSDSTSAEVTETGGVSSVASDGFNLIGNNTIIGGTNPSGEALVAWNWLAGGTASSNTDGSITSSVSANTTSGFSIVSYTGSTGNYTVGHGLGVAPKFIMVKSRDVSRNWVAYHIGMGAGYWIYPNQTSAQSPDANYWNNTNPTSSVFSISNVNYPENNANGENYIAYCFAEKKGFSKFGSYTGNGSTDGTFVYTGFKPAMVILKKTSVGGDNWQIRDNKRDTYNAANHLLKPNASTAEQTTDAMDYCSNGFKWRNSAGEVNASGATFIYMAFAENPLVGTNNIPACAR